MRSRFPILLVMLIAGVQSMDNNLFAAVFMQEKRTFFTVSDGLPAAGVNDILVATDGSVYAATGQGLAWYDGKAWRTVESTRGRSVHRLAGDGDRVIALMDEPGRSLLFIARGQVQNRKVLNSLPADAAISALACHKQVYLAAGETVFILASEKTKPQPLPRPGGAVRQIAVDSSGSLYAAADNGLFRYSATAKAWSVLSPRQGKKSWSLQDVRGVTLDRLGRLWFASPQGVGCKTAKGWSLYTGHEGLPFDDFTTLASGPDSSIWFGTTMGAIRFDGRNWEYRQGLRWLPNDLVNDIAVSQSGDAWLATNQGIARIYREPMTLAQKAAWFEEEIDRYHRRTPYEFVLEVAVKNPGDKTEFVQSDSDNDGLWTSMYGAGECFAYAATRDPLAKRRADKAFQAMRFLGQVTQGGTHPAPPGFVCRTVLPTSGPDPNIGRLEDDRRNQASRDRLWKVFEPRWPVSADGEWYWKTDTSSDELDGHYFLYGLYYDLVAETEAEKRQVQEQVRGLTDHLIKHGCKLIDHDGQPTRWARYDPAELNFDPRWFIERGLNSLSMLSYLATTAHITGDAKYRIVADSLIKRHGYLQNLMNMKVQRGIGTGNQSDDEMAFMCYYNLIKYEPDPLRRSQYAASFWLTWRLEAPEMNPLFNFLMAASCNGVRYADQWGTHALDATGDWLEDGVETLKRFPLDRFDWRHDNSRRIDLIRLSELGACFDENPQDFPRRGYRVNGKVIPVDECHFNHWNRNPFELKTGGSGRTLSDGAVYLLPYYSGLYYGFIKE
ncbi:MAG TPA: hypothetical protein PK843_00825 [bacterium]|nr:hypothetical protein [bacterium]